MERRDIAYHEDLHDGFFDCDYCGGDGWVEVDDPINDYCDEIGHGECRRCNGLGYIRAKLPPAEGMMEAPEKLKPCPFCGVSLIRLRSEFRGDISWSWEHPDKSVDCWLSRSCVADEAGFIDAWNTRTCTMPGELVDRARHAATYSRVSEAWVMEARNLLADIWAWHEGKKG